MKKIITLFLTLLLILVMAVPAYAVTPPLSTPSVTVPDISDSVHVELPDSVFDAYIPDITIEPTEAPTEPPAENEPACTDWHGWLSGWLSWWRDKIC